MSSYHTIMKILGGDNNMANERRSIDERIAELQEKQKQLKEQEKKLRAKQSQEERKKLTKRLIEDRSELKELATVGVGVL